MKKLLMLTAVVGCVVLSPAAHAEWTWVVKAHNGNTTYVDFGSIKKHDGKVYYWQLTDWVKPNEDGRLSTIQFNEAECGRFRSRHLNFIVYDGQMGKGKIIGLTNTPAKDWDYPLPDSVGNAELNAVCNHKP